MASTAVDKNSFVWRASPTSKKVHLFLKTSHGLGPTPLCMLFLCLDHREAELPECKPCSNIAKMFDE